MKGRRVREFKFRQWRYKRNLWNLFRRKKHIEFITRREEKAGKCLWCSKPLDVMMASCGTGTTWSLLKCPHCEKLTASAIMPGGIIPIEVINDPEIKITYWC